MSERIGDHEEVENSIAAYVLGATETEENDSIQHHLDGCAGCRELAERLRRAVDMLPLATELVEPPARLRAKILAAAGASRISLAAAAPLRSKILRLPQRRWTPTPWLVRFPQQAAVAVLAVAVLGLGAWNIRLTGQVADAQGAAQKSVYTRTLPGTGALANSQAKVVELRGQSLALVSFNGMPGVGADKVYELWLITSDGTPEPAGTFLPERDGTKVLVIPKDISIYRQIGVTVESGPNGSPKPTQPPVLVGTL